MNTDLTTTFKPALTLCVVAILEIESTSNFLLHWYHYTNTLLTLLNSIAEIIVS